MFEALAIFMIFCNIVTGLLMTFCSEDFPEDADPDLF